jgi:hypothetical protein
LAFGVADRDRKKLDELFRVAGPARSMEFGAAKEPTETAASSESDIAAEGVH